MSEQDYWRQLISEAERSKTIEAIILLREEGGTSNAALWTCEDGEHYFVKMPEPEAIRSSVNEQIGPLGNSS